MKVSLLSLALLLPGLLLAQLPDPGSPAEEVVLEMISSVNLRDLDSLDAFVAEDVHRYCDATPELTIESLEQFKAFLQQDFAGVPDSVISVNQIFSADNMVAVHATYAGIQSGPMGPFPASDKYVEISFISTLRVEEGKIAEMWVEWDNLNIMMQLGHITPESLFSSTTEE